MGKQETAIAVRQDQSVAPAYVPPSYMEKLLNGDLTELTPEERTHYYLERCDRLGLDPMSQPFLFLQTKQGNNSTEKPKTILYTTRSATDQIANRDGLSGAIVSRELLGAIAVVVVRITGKDGRTTENLGAASFKYDYQAGDALKRAATQGFRRGIIQHSGLGMVNEEDVVDIAGAVKLGMHDVLLPSAADLPRLPQTTTITNTATGEMTEPAIAAAPAWQPTDPAPADWRPNLLDLARSIFDLTGVGVVIPEQFTIAEGRKLNKDLKAKLAAAKATDQIVPQNTEEELDAAFPESEAPWSESIPAHVGTP